MEPEEKSSPLPAILLIVAVLSVVVACFASVGGWETAKPAVAAKATNPEFQLGEIVKIAGVNGGVIIATTPVAGATLQRLLIADDAEGLREMREAGLSWFEDTGGHARILGFDPDPEATQKLGCGIVWVQIRRTDGEYKNSVGWTDVAGLVRR